MLISHEMAAESGRSVQCASWHTAYPAEAVASEATSAACQNRLEDVRILPIIEPELKFSKVEWQVSFADVVVSPDYSALQKTPKALHVVSVDFTTNIFTVTMAYGFMRQTLPRFQILIAGVLVGRDKGDILTYRFRHEFVHGRNVRSLNHLANDIALARNSADDRSLVPAAPTMLAFVPMPVLILAADIRFINLDLSHQLRKVFVPHCGADTLTHIPGSFVRTRANHPMELQSAHALFALTHQVDDFKPRAQWIVRILENRLCNYRESIAVFLAYAALPVKPFMPERIDLIVAATRALNHAIWPAHIAKQRLACVLAFVIAFYIGQSQVRLSRQWPF